MKINIEAAHQHDSGLSMLIESRQEVAGAKLCRMLTEAYRVRDEMMQETREEVRQAKEYFQLLAKGEAHES